MIRVGLTGGIGTGKSVVAGILTKHGIPVIDADLIARELIDKDHGIRAKIISEFGADVYQVNGELDRQKMSKIVFSNDDARLKLNEIVHPVVIARQEEILAELAEMGVEFACLESALIYEANSTSQFDYIVVVTSRRELVIERLKRRNGITEKQVKARIDAQMSVNQKAELADYVIDNSGDHGELEKSVVKLIDWLRDRKTTN